VKLRHQEVCEQFSNTEMIGMSGHIRRAGIYLHEHKGWGKVEERTRGNKVIFHFHRPILHNKFEQTMNNELIPQNASEATTVSLSEIHNALVAIIKSQQILVSRINILVEDLHPTVTNPLVSFDVKQKT
jgi:hypothetical protein